MSGLDQGRSQTKIQGGPKTPILFFGRSPAYITERNVKIKLETTQLSQFLPVERHVKKYAVVLLAKGLRTESLKTMKRLNLNIF